MEQIDSTQFKALMKRIRDDLNAHLSTYKREGVGSLSIGNGKYDPEAGTFSFKLEGKLAGAKGKEALSYEYLVQLYALSPSSPKLPPLGTAFNYAHDGQRHTIIGANRGEKIITRRPDGKQFLFRPEAIARLTAVQS
jgi:hypothetical protein